MKTKAYIIHLEKAKERREIVENLSRIFSDAELYPAKDGSEWSANESIKKSHPHTKSPVSQGNIGCTHSHIDILHGALARGEHTVILLEDDCDFNIGVEADDIMKYIHLSNTLGEPWDILLIGASEFVEKSPTTSSDYMKVRRFWGTHALVLRERGMRAVLKAFAASQQRGEFLPADWLYNEAIQRHGLVCFGPAVPLKLCRQKEGYTSYITGSVRKY